MPTRVTGSESCSRVRPWRTIFAKIGAALWVLMAALMPPASAQAGTPAVTVAAGGYHTCAILVTGSVKCWGNNSQGQLGLGDTENRGDNPGEMGGTLPAVFVNQQGPITQLALGNVHTCMLDAEGGVFCWGYNAHGQLGDRSISNRGDNPGEVSGAMVPQMTGVRKITAGVFHTCALKQDGKVWCWGANYAGQLGVGDTQNRGDNVNPSFAIPDLGTGRTAVDVVAAGDSTCALLDNQTIKCWGSNAFGKLGLGDLANRGDGPGEMGDALPAVDIRSASTRTLYGGGSHICATVGNINPSTSAVCWGRNDHGQLGLGDLNDRGDNPGEMGDALPRLTTGFLFQMAVGYAHTCVPAYVASSGRQGIRCFGHNEFGQLGRGNADDWGFRAGERVTTLSPPPIDLGHEGFYPKPLIVNGMTAGVDHTCALLSGGAIKCWGGNTEGQLGLGDTESRGDNPGEMGAALPVVDL